MPPSPLPPAEPTDHPLYEEQLWPAPWIWGVAAGASGASILTFAPISLTAGFVAAAVVAVVLAVLLVVSTPRLRVTDSCLEVGKARIERQHVGRVQAFTGEAATAQRGPLLDARAYLCIRGWISPVVRVEVTDPADPTPYWLTSTRRPDRLVAVLTAPQ
jgi:hypothetical protein